MTGVLKARQSAVLVRPAALAPASGPAPCIEELRLAEATTEAERLRVALADAQQAAAQAEARAREEGRREGRAAAATEDAERTRLVGKALDDALEAWRESLSRLDALAPRIARAAVDKLFADSEMIGGLVERAAARRIELLRHESGRALRLSPEDFPDATALEALRGKIGFETIEIRLDPALSRGTCILDFKLGHADLSPEAQWRGLAAILDKMAEEDAQ